MSGGDTCQCAPLEKFLLHRGKVELMQYKLPAFNATIANGGQQILAFVRLSKMLIHTQKNPDNMEGDTSKTKGFCYWLAYVSWLRRWLYKWYCYYTTILFMLLLFLFLLPTRLCSSPCVPRFWLFTSSLIETPISQLLAALGAPSLLSCEDKKVP